MISTTEAFMKQAVAAHGNRYDYSEVVYVNAKKKVKIRCREHGVFEQSPIFHCYGNNCPACALTARVRKPASECCSSTEMFIERARQLHGDRWDYSKTVYTKARHKVIISCAQHGDFEKLPSDHLYGTVDKPLGGCPKCKSRKPNQAES